MLMRVMSGWASTGGVLLAGAAMSKTVPP
jgi:hypothetical protein